MQRAINFKYKGWNFVLPSSSFLHKSSLFIGVMIIFSSIAIAQDTVPAKPISPPIPVEVLFGKRLVFQMVINKKFAPQSKFGFFSVSSLAADYENDKTNNDFITIVMVNYEIIKRVSITSCMATNSTWGFRPLTGLQYTFANQKLLVVLLPIFYLTEPNFESLAIFEYKPKIKNDWRLYTRLQILYNINTETGKHDRSYVNARLGVTYKTFGFGLGTNLDRYGPMKVQKENYGIFLRAALP